MRKQGFLFVLILFAFYGNAYCEDIAYVVTQDLSLWRNDSGKTAGGATVTKDETVFFQGRITRETTRDGYRFLILVRTEQGREGWIDARHISLPNSLSLPDSVIVKHWIYSFYQHILLEQEKETLFLYEPFWQGEYYDDENMMTENDIFGKYTPWWKNVYPTSFYIQNNFLEISEIFISDYILFVTVRHRQEGNILTVDVVCVDKGDRHPQNYLNKRFNEGETYRLIFKIDGDYMDVFVNDDTTKITTLIGVDDYFVEAVYGILKGETIDLSRIIWPRRADGSIDSPPYGLSIMPNVTEELKQPETAELFVDTAAESQLSAQNSPKTNALPLWAWLAIGGAVVIAGTVVLFVLRRKR